VLRLGKLLCYKLRTYNTLKICHMKNLANIIHQSTQSFSDVKTLKLKGDVMYKVGMVNVQNVHQI
jgi:hypothetical protein